MSVIDRYLEVLLSCFQYDVEVFSKPWLYAWLIPAAFYLAFFVVKWAILTLPFWIGPVIIIETARSVKHLIEPNSKSSKLETSND